MSKSVAKWLTTIAFTSGCIVSAKPVETSPQVPEFSFSLALIVITGIGAIVSVIACLAHCQKHYPDSSDDYDTTNLTATSRKTKRRASQSSSDDSPAPKAKKRRDSVSASKKYVSESCSSIKSDKEVPASSTASERSCRISIPGSRGTSPMSGALLTKSPNSTLFVALDGDPLVVNRMRSAEIVRRRSTPKHYLLRPPPMSAETVGNLGNDTPENHGEEGSTVSLQSCLSQEHLIDYGSNPIVGGRKIPPSSLQVTTPPPTPKSGSGMPGTANGPPASAPLKNA